MSPIDSSHDRVPIGENYKCANGWEWFPDKKHIKADIESLIAFLRGKCDSVLDIPCGVGSISAGLAKAGFEVTGTDANPFFIAAARSRCRKCEFVRGDMREFSSENRFGCVLNWYTSFGYFSDVENRELVRKFAGLLEDGGILIIETENMLGSGEIRAEDMVQGMGWDRERRCAVHSNTADPSDTCVYEIRFYSADEMRGMMEDAGLREFRMYSDRFSPYRNDSDRVIYVGRR
ncbi:MAG: class I SAM-dependent methyltransferase [Candidatus Methanomethylophilaceae archaeon]|nr:class I SAM-dependent methyltransferase [Candidatus Methanomethylophilaceae archaeon]